MKQQKLVLAVLVFLLFIGFLYLISTPDTSMESRVNRDRARDVARFLPQNSVDISMAMGLIKHDAPRMLNPPTSPPPLLMYPPSAETLNSMCGV
jgi:hypothetical protein